jgi:hypothetical protein
MIPRTENDITQIAEALIGINHELERLNNFLEEKAFTVMLDPESKLDVDVNNTIFTSSAE